MAKNIDVNAHVNRYLDTDLKDVTKLHAALGEFIEQRKKDEILALKAKLEILESGGDIPEEPIIEKPTRTRTRKKKSVQETEEE